MFGDLISPKMASDYFKIVHRFLYPAKGAVYARPGLPNLFSN